MRGQGTQPVRSLGFPSTKDFLWILQSNQIKDCPVTVIDAKAAYKIWGPSVAALKGKTVRKQPEPVKTETIYIPKEIRELHKEVTPTIDFFCQPNTVLHHSKQSDTTQR